MLQTTRSYRGMVTAPHHLAARAGLRVLEEGGNAVEAMIAAAATITVVYPHMNDMGGDNFWLIHTPGEDIVGIDACGGAAAKADPAFYRDRGYDAIPSRGPLAALTVAGAVSGWQAAWAFSRDHWDGKLSVARLLEDATHYAQAGVAVTRTLAENARAKMDELEDAPGFTNAFFVDGALPAVGARFRQPRIAATLERLAAAGLDDFYRGDLARAIAADLERAGTPLRLADLEQHRALQVAPLSLTVAGHEVFNMPPPTQGLASLLLLGVYERLNVSQAETFDYVHGLVEAAKRAFRVRDRYLYDPAYMEVNPADFLAASVLDDMARDIDPERALPWPDADPGGDTVWLGAVDGEGHHNCLRPHRRPFHTIQPALARLADGRVMPYGAMGGEGQPQTQAMLFSRHVLHGQDLQAAVTAPRWLLGRTWGAETASLRIEDRFDPAVIAALRAAGHDLEVISPFDEVMGHAGALVHHPDGLIEGAADPRGDGQAAGF
jgi:gamma-glutamyltranspeptidase/glutathione hydrolase